MGAEPILSRFDALRVWGRGDQRAPHKPLLVLYALGRWARGETELALAEVDPALPSLLKEFGPPHRTSSIYPFWRLQNDGVWLVQAEGTLKSRKGNTDPPKTELLAHHARGGFSDEVKS